MKKEKSATEKKYTMGVIVKNSGQENGPGHASVFIKKDEGGKTVQLNHTSFFPGGLGSLVNGATLGTVPVLGENGHTKEAFMADLKESNVVLTKPLSKDEYRAVKNEKSVINKEIESGKVAYSVFGRLNPFANLFVGVKTPAEDHFGIHHEDTVITSPKEVHNCASVVTKVVNASGTKIDNPVIPTLFTDKLRDAGFEEAASDSISSTICDSTTRFTK
ncbi:hypothetical protein GH742_08890 [Legionella sp. MW5194]|uniref:hypothetical protein n=1 Tax=Legionella sp. MW5194 TaxID=2662448 RepID=UPI00193E6DB6|nr:hypothetical protein [Legionella sp. MW5194]QRN03973.1 hypothetical protein GH742_08890 [Legionella sp. MW5194]